MLFNRLLTENNVNIETVDYSIGAIKLTGKEDYQVFKKELIRLINARVKITYENIVEFFEIDYDVLNALIYMLEVLNDVPETEWFEIVDNEEKLKMLVKQIGGSITLNTFGDELFLNDISVCVENGVHIEFLIRLNRDATPIPISFSPISLKEFGVFVKSIRDEVHDLTVSFNDYQGLSESEVKELHGKAHNLMFTPKIDDELTDLIDSGVIDLYDKDISNNNVVDLFGGLLDEEGHLKTQLNLPN